jgi:hypothetical protein
VEWSQADDRNWQGRRGETAFKGSVPAGTALPTGSLRASQLPRGTAPGALAQERPLGCHKFRFIVAARKQVAIDVRRHLD